MRWIKLFESWEEATSRLPEKEVIPLNISSLKLAIVRRKEELFIFERNCPHQHEPLISATFNEFNEIICPLHEYRFNLGSGVESNRRCRDLLLYPVKIDGEVFVGIK